MGSGQVESEQEIEVDLGFGMLGLGLGFLMGNGDLVERGERGTKRRHAKISIVKLGELRRASKLQLLPKVKGSF